MMEFSKYDSDPEALAWARSKVERLIAKYEGFEQQAREKGTSDPSFWRKSANLLRMELIGGSGCVITPFDERLPTFVEALSEPPEASR